MKPKPLRPGARAFLITTILLTAALLVGCDGGDVKINYAIQIFGPSSIVIGDDFTVKLNITGSEETPTGKYDITDSSGAGCKGQTLGANGKGSCLMSSGHLTVGTETITGTFYKDTNNSKGHSVTYDVNIEKHPTTITITSFKPRLGIPSFFGNLPTVFSGDYVDIIITVNGFNPTGEIAIEVAEQERIVKQLYEARLEAQVAFSIQMIAEAAYKRSYEHIAEIFMSLDYMGDASNSSSQDGVIIMVYRAGQNIYIHSPQPESGPLNLGEPIDVVVHVYGEGPIPTGSVVISGDTECTAELTTQVDDHTAEGTCPITFTNPRNSVSIRVDYSGDNYYETQFGSFPYSMLDFDSTTTITGIFPDQPLVNEWVTVIVDVDAGGSTPDGTVTITGADTTCTINLTNGEDRCSVMFNSKGTKTLIATYSGTLGVNGSQGTLVVEVIKLEPTEPPE